MEYDAIWGMNQHGLAGIMGYDIITTKNGVLVPEKRNYLWSTANLYRIIHFINLLRHY